MDVLREIAVWALLGTGSVFCMIGGLGMLRMPDFYTRSHAASVTDTMGASLILVGLGIHEGPTLVSVKLFFIFLFLYLTGPTAAHALVKAAYSKGLEAADVQEATGAGLPLRGDDGSREEIG